MSDTRWWRLKRWLTDLLSDEGLGVSEIGALLDRDADKLYVGMILKDMIHQGELKWNLDGTFTLVTKQRGEKE